MPLQLSQYKSFVFDCDGVLLNSNQLKTDAFYQSVLEYGINPANELVQYHMQNGGISRYQKFNYFLDTILPRYLENSQLLLPTLDELIFKYESYLDSHLMSCQITPDLMKFRQLTQSSSWLIVSGGKQDELRDIFKKREIYHFFDGGIYGSPNTKEQILAKLIKESKLTLPALFMGDSKYDYVAASSAGLDFIFVSQWTDLPDWENFVTEESLQSVPLVNSLLNYHYQCCN